MALARDLIDRELHDEPIQSFDKRHIELVLANTSRVKSAMSWILNDSIPIETRFSEVMDRGSRHHSPGLGNGAYSEWLMFSDPSRYGIWNAKSVAGLSRLGMMPPFRRGTSSGDRYNSIVLALQEIQEITGARNLAEVDLFLHFVGKPEPEAQVAWTQVFRDKMPTVARTAASHVGSGGVQGATHLSERGYVRHTSQATVWVEKLHSRLSNRLAKWLSGSAVRATNVHQEKSRTDVTCAYRGEARVFELKIIGDLGGPNAGHREVRSAVGQLLDYGYFPFGRPKYDRLAIVTDIEPCANDRRWIKALGSLLPPIELYWFPDGATSPISPQLTKDPLARKASPPKT